MFIAVLFIITKNLQSRCSSVSIHLCYIYTMEYNLAMQRNELSNYNKDMEYKCILISERSQYEKTAYCIFQLCDTSVNTKLY